MDIKKIAITAGALALGVVLYRFIKHESAEMKAERAKTPLEPQQPKGIFDLFKSYTEPYSNYVNEGFMGFSASDENIMLGGGKRVGFMNASGKPPIATDEPNFAYANKEFN
jgi:hypothetical protein